MLPTKESLTVEFKSEQKRPQSHDEIVDNVVALANTEGGTLYLGIEDDGTVTGVCDEHRNINELAALILAFRCLVWVSGSGVVVVVG